MAWRGGLAIFMLLLTVAPCSAEIPPDLIESSRRIERFSETKGQGSESERLKQFFDLHWHTRLLESPEYSTYIGHTELDDRLDDVSPEMIALARQINRLELGALGSIDRSRLAPDEQVNYNLLHWRLEQAIEGERFPSELLQVHQLSGVHQSVVDLLATPWRSIRRSRCSSRGSRRGSRRRG
jgi:uncharacterized protein (DUF885 family)